MVIFFFSFNVFPFPLSLNIPLFLSLSLFFSRFLSPLSLVFPSQDVNEWVAEFLAQNVKVSRLLEIKDVALEMREKESVARRLLGSLVYDFAKNFSSRFAASKVSRQTAFNLFWSRFSNFRVSEASLVHYRGKQCCFGAMCRTMFSSAVSHHISRLIKRHELEMSE